jgi:protein-S-isoprenylcysteine O-methyltransferase Ste14
VPRVLNVFLAVVLLLLVAPVVTQFDGKRWYVQIVLVSVTVPVVLLALACLSSAARPGSLGRGLRRLRARRRR